MAGGSAKKISAENARTLQTCIIGNVVSAVRKPFPFPFLSFPFHHPSTSSDAVEQAIFVVIRMYFYYESLGFWSALGFLLVNSLSVLIYVQFNKQSSKGFDINSPGLNE